jgi:histone acetyltransferase 1
LISVPGEKIVLITKLFSYFSERVVGYHGLKIRLYYGAGSLTTLLDMSYEDKVETKDPGDLVVQFADRNKFQKPEINLCSIPQADDVMKIIGEKLEPGFLTNISDFTKALEKEKSFKPEGSLVNKFTISSGNREQNKEICFHFIIEFSGKPLFHCCFI